MLVATPIELLDHPGCYFRDTDGIYRAKESATLKERMAVEKLNRQWEYKRKLEDEMEAEVKASEQFFISEMGVEAYNKAVQACEERAKARKQVQML